jgi:CubicO group peptidase (beta-lactamase class C family)
VFLKGAVAVGVAVAAAASLDGPLSIVRASSLSAVLPFDWQQFDAAVQSAMQTFDMVGAAVAVVAADRTLHGQTFGVRDSGAPVTPATLFRVASTNSMMSLLVATFVDDGTLSWDQPLRDL